MKKNYLIDRRITSLRTSGDIATGGPGLPPPLSLSFGELLEDSTRYAVFRSSRIRIAQVVNEKTNLLRKDVCYQYFVLCKRFES